LLDFLCELYYDARIHEHQVIQLYYNSNMIKYRKTACTVFLMMRILFSKGTFTKERTTSK